MEVRPSINGTPHLGIIILTLFVSLIPGIPRTVFADWQSTLESQFDIVETFDELPDWVPPDANAVDSKFDPIMNKMPQKVSPKAPQWSFYTVGGLPRDYSGTVKWIANHGAGNVLRGTGKSLVIDYGDITAKGPQRMAFMLGDSPDDGYKDAVHFFMWIKYNKGFFPFDSNNDLWGGWYNKVFQISSGFRGVYKWGNQTEYDFIDPNGGNYNIQHDYGMNYSVFDIVSGQASYNPVPRMGIFGRTPKTDCSGIAYAVENILNYEINLKQKILNGEWFAIEVRVVKSTPGQSNGSYTEWAYNQDGSLIGTFTLNNVPTFANCGTFTYNHGYNKFLIGGNRGAYGTPVGTFIQRTDGNNATESHMYVDDVIVNASRIGPTYFALLNPNPAEDKIPPTGSLKINNGAQYTNTLDVELAISASDIGSGMGSGAEMQFSNDRSIWSTPEPYATVKNWRLLPGFGKKTVYMKLKDAAGNWMLTEVSNSIGYPQPPQNINATPSSTN